MLEFRQQDVQTVALNEELSLFFSAPLDASSVTSESVRILDEEGQVVRGERRVRGRALSILPDLPSAADLADGGLRPGRRYRVVLGGFPRPDSLRSSEGALLAAGLVLSFATSEPGGPSPLFLDPHRGPSGMQPRGRPGPGNAFELEDGRLLLECDEALDPSSIPACRFLLSPTAPGSSELLVRARLIENRRNRAVVELALAGAEAPADGRLLAGTYFLSLPAPGLLTLGQRPVEPRLPWFVLTVPPRRASVPLTGERDLESARVPGCAGTVRLDPEQAALRLRFPAAAGAGTDGVVGAEELLSARDLHATRILVPAGALVDLSARVGPVVLRSQTSIQIEGQVVRRGGSLARNPLASVPVLLTEELRGLAGRERSQWPALTPWLQRLLEPDRDWSQESWTVLVAAGDLVIPTGGLLEVEGNLVLVAGGQIRVDGRAFARENLWRSGEGGNLAAPGNALLPLQLDEPTLNPLRVPFVLGVRTRPLPLLRAPGDVRTWLIGHEGSGRLLATLLEDPTGSDAAELGAGRLVRYEIRLTMTPGVGEAWDPPRLERLEVEGLGLVTGRAERP